MLLAWIRPFLLLSLILAAQSCALKEEAPADAEVTAEDGSEAADAEDAEADTADNSSEDAAAAEEASPANSDEVADAGSSTLPPAQESSVSPDLGESVAESAPAAPAEQAEAALAEGTQLVMYVRKNGTSVLSQPNGKAHATMDRGDHAVVTIEGQWARTASGQYIALGSLTRNSVGRDRGANDWK